MADRNPSPCLSCKRYSAPGGCDRKVCQPWREWWLSRWDAIQTVKISRLEYEILKAKARELEALKSAK